MMKLVSDNNLAKLTEKQMCWEMMTEACRFRQCKNCSGKNIKIDHYDEEEVCYYYGWVTKVEVERNKQEHSHTGKERISCSVGELVTRFEGVVVQ